MGYRTIGARRRRRLPCVSLLQFESLEDRLPLTAASDDGGLEFLAGDANFDQRFDQADLLQVLRAGKYLTGESATWN